MSDAGNAEQPPAAKRFAIGQSVEGFVATRDISALGRAGHDEFYRYSESAKSGEQLPLFRADQMSQAIVDEHALNPDPPDINLYAATDCTIGGAGLLVKDDRIWLPSDCYPGYLGSLCEHAGGVLPDIWAGALNKAAPAVTRHDLVCASPLHPNLVYGHFLIEILPRLYLLRAARDMGADFKVALRQNIPDWTRTFINLFFAEDDLLWYDHRNEVLLPNAVLSPGMMHREYSFHPLLNVAVADVHLRAKAATTMSARDDGAPRLIYLSRTRIPGAWHKLKNETEVEDTFRNAGFTIVHPQDLPLGDQLAIYQGADCIAGQYSSALHNALFARRGIKVLSLNRINWYQSMIARLRGQHLGFLAPADGVMRDWRTRGAELVEYAIDCAELKAYITDFLRWEAIDQTIWPRRSNLDANTDIRQRVAKTEYNGAEGGTGAQSGFLPGLENGGKPQMDIKKRLRMSALDDLPPLYHSYALFGVDNKQIPGMYEKNQLSKQHVILAYIQLAIAKCKQSIGDPVSFVELFCADGFFAMAAMHLGATSSYGIDRDGDGHSMRMMGIAARLGINVGFKNMDVADIDQLAPVDIVANIGGLYHVSQPEDILEKSYRLAKRFLIVQNVVSMATNDPDYFETPAPGWTWGSRYSRASFERMLSSKSWKVLDTHFNILEGNGRVEDIGSCYALIEKPAV